MSHKKFVELEIHLLLEKHRNEHSKKDANLLKSEFI